MRCAIGGLKVESVRAEGAMEAERSVLVWHGGLSWRGRRRERQRSGEEEKEEAEEDVVVFESFVVVITNVTEARGWEHAQPSGVI